MMRVDNQEILNTLKDAVQFLDSSEVAQTNVGISAYGRVLRIQRLINAMEAEMAEEDAYIELMAERMGY
jgi:3,4-dihydroxy-2-butanone 4-phosphate synthase